MQGLFLLLILLDSHCLAKNSSFAKYIATVTTDSLALRSLTIQETIYLTNAYFPLTVKALSTKLDNMDEQKTRGLFSPLPNSLQCDLLQTTSCLSLSRTEVSLLPSCAIYGQAMRTMHIAQRWHVQYKSHTYLSKAEFYPLRILQVFIHYWNCQKTHSISIDEQNEIDS